MSFFSLVHITPPLGYSALQSTEPDRAAVQRRLQPSWMRLSLPLGVIFLGVPASPNWPPSLCFQSDQSMSSLLNSVHQPFDSRACSLFLSPGYFLRSCLVWVCSPLALRSFCLLPPLCSLLVRVGHFSVDHSCGCLSAWSAVLAVAQG